MESQVATPNTEAAILARVIEADQTEITPEIARYLLSMRLPAADSIRVDELSDKARGGLLNGAEAAELDSYLHIGSLLGVLHARARRLLRNPPSPSPQ
jgi:hypothetical protein